MGTLLQMMRDTLLSEMSNLESTDSKLLGLLEVCTHNDFANNVEKYLGKAKADLFRKAAIKENKWIKMDGVIYNGTQ